MSSWVLYINQGSPTLGCGQLPGGGIFGTGLYEWLAGARVCGSICLSGSWQPFMCGLVPLSPQLGRQRSPTLAAWGGKGEQGYVSGQLACACEHMQPLCEQQAGVQAHSSTCTNGRLARAPLTWPNFKYATAQQWAMAQWLGTPAISCAPNISNLISYLFHPTKMNFAFFPQVAFLLI